MTAINNEQDIFVDEFVTKNSYIDINQDETDRIIHDVETEGIKRINSWDQNNKGENIMNPTKHYSIDPKQVQVHPDARIICEATFNEIKQLEDSINRHGQVEPAKMLNGHLLDGRARAQVSATLGLSLVVEDLPENTNPKVYISTHNMARRQMSLPQKAAVATVMTDYIKSTSMKDKVKLAGIICNVPEKFIYQCLDVRDNSIEAFNGVHNGSMNLNKALSQTQEWRGNSLSSLNQSRNMINSENQYLTKENLK